MDLAHRAASIAHAPEATLFGCHLVDTGVSLTPAAHLASHWNGHARLPTQQGHRWAQTPYTAKAGTVNSPALGRGSFHVTPDQEVPRTCPSDAAKPPPPPRPE